jgi:hypothetical protein
MARIDDYRQARKITREELAKTDPELIARLSGASFSGEDQGTKAFSLPFLNEKLSISWPGLEFSFAKKVKDVPIQQQVLILHYLHGSLSSGGASLTGEWISFQDVPDGRFYMDAFIKRAKDPLINTFGSVPKHLAELASKAYGATPLDYGDFSVIVKAFPLIQLALVLWEGDDEFPPEGNILFDKNIAKILSAEDIAWLAGMVVYPLMGMSVK